jgi:release factor glutamine methyltransferase
VTYHELTVAARARLERAGIASDVAQLDAELLARHVLGWDRALWLGHRSDPATPSFSADYQPLIARREAREPMAYIRGVQEFWGRAFRVTPAVLIPRPETELLIEAVAPFLTERPSARVVDVGTGSGCIAVTLALEHPSITVHATDISAAALEVARENATRLAADARITLVHGAYLASTPTPVDLIVSNPPYVAALDRVTLPPEVRRYEPAEALFADADGLRDVRALIDVAQQSLTSGGQLAFEIGLGQSADVTHAIADAPALELIHILADLQGIARTVVARRVDRPR